MELILPPTATPQEFFDFMVSKIVEQGEQSHLGYACRYRSTNQDGKELKCAVGHLIKDEDYREDMEGPAGSLLRQHYSSYSDFATLFTHVQRAHDSVPSNSTDFVGTFLREAEKVAASNNLEWNF